MTAFGVRSPLGTALSITAIVAFNGTLGALESRAAPTAVPDSVAADASQRLGAVPVTQGISSSDVFSTFGPPDKIQKAATGDQETWFYGSATLFLTGGKVVGWSGAQELAGRVRLQSVQKKPSATPTAEQASEAGWINPWTADPQSPSEAVIDELLELESKTP